MSAPLVRRSPAHTGTVVATVDLTPRMRRVTVASETMRDVAVRPAQDVEVFLSEPTGRRVKRRYTIRRHRADAGEIDLDVLVHGHGPGSAWAASAAPGDAVQFQGPRGKLELRPAAWHLLVGDESALPAIASIAESLSADESAVALLEIDGASDELPVAADVHWVVREGAPAGGPDLLAHALENLEPPAGIARAYLMGETRAMVALRPLVEAKGVPHDAVFVKGYWNLGRPDRIAGRSPTAG